MKNQTNNQSTNWRTILIFYGLGVFTAVAPFITIFCLNIAIDGLISGDRQIDYRVISTTTSNDREFIATVYVSSGGGAAGWCRTNVSVNPTFAKLAIAENDIKNAENIFYVSCGSKVETKWLSNRSLIISFTDSEEWISISKKKSDTSGQVTIKYLVKVN